MCCTDREDIALNTCLWVGDPLHLLLQGNGCPKEKLLVVEVTSRKSNFCFTLFSLVDWSHRRSQMTIANCSACSPLLLGAVYNICEEIAPSLELLHTCLLQGNSIPYRSRDGFAGFSRLWLPLCFDLENARLPELLSVRAFSKILSMSFPRYFSSKGLVTGFLHEVNMFT